VPALRDAVVPRRARRQHFHDEERTLDRHVGARPPAGYRWHGIQVRLEDCPVNEMDRRRAKANLTKPMGLSIRIQHVIQRQDDASPEKAWELCKP
jgi:hypothetical protein